MRGVSLKTAKMTIHHLLLLCYKDLDSVLYLLVLFLFFQKSLGSVVGILGCSGAPAFGRAVRISLHGSRCHLANGAEVFLPDCHCSAQGK